MKLKSAECVHFEPSKETHWMQRSTYEPSQDRSIVWTTLE